MILFVKYLSDKAQQGQMDLEVPKGCHFEDFVALKQNPHIGEEINKKLEAIREANTAFIRGLSLPNFNDDTKLGTGKTKVETLSKLIGEFERDELDFSLNRAADDDLLGDAYEYLMKNFAAESGKSKGQFYTPAEVSRVMAKVLHLEGFVRAKDTIYDMTCGSGSLLLRALSETNGLPTLYGQEKDSTTASLAKLNMLLHGIVSAVIQVGDTLNDPQFTTLSMLQTFDVCVANPPFSQKGWLASGGESDEYNRWNKHMLPPAKCGDYAFLLHLIASMKADTGRGACILPHGVLFRGNAEYTIRRHIVEHHLIKGIIGLPPNLFFGTGIPACIIILDRRDATTRSGIFFIDAKEGFMKDGAKNRLREQDIQRILDAWNAQEAIPHYARLATWQEIKANDFNLNIPRYITPRDTEVHQDIECHLHGGLPLTDIDAMDLYWQACPTLRFALFSTDEAGRIHLATTKDHIAEAVATDKSFLRQSALFEGELQEWAEQVRPQMMAITSNCQPKRLIAEWSERLLATSKAGASLVDPYAVYDRLMNYWAQTMQDDCYMIANDGWTLPGDLLSTKRRGTYPDIHCDLLPVEIVLAEYFKDETDAIATAEQKVDEAQSAIDDYVEKHADDFDNLESVSEATVRKAIKQGTVPAAACQEYLKRTKDKKDAARALSTLQDALTKKVLDRYQALTPDDIRRLVVDRKWLATVLDSCREEMNTLTQQLTADISALATRYEYTLPELEAEVQRGEQEVSRYLSQMGFNIDKI